MKKHVNVIQIKGPKGIILAIGVISCLFAGFIVFPGIIAMYLWNYISAYTTIFPAIGIIQGILLWGILIASYYTFRKEKHVVCLRTPIDGLNEEELKKVFADMKKQAEQDPIINSMIKAHEMELQIKKIKEDCVTTPELSQNTSQQEHIEKIESK